MKRSFLQQQRYNSLKNHKRFKRSVKRQTRNTSQVRLNYNQPKRPTIEKKLGEKDETKPEISDTLKYLLSNVNFFTRQGIHINDEGIITIPKIFSLTRKPEESNAFLKKLLYTLTYPKNPHIKIDYARCEEIDLGASITMDIILKNYIQYFRELKARHQRIPIQTIEAINIHNEHVNKFLSAIGANKTILGMDTSFSDILTYELRTGDKTGNKGQIEIESTKLVEHIEKCLNKMGKSLNQEASENFADIIGEVLNNAEVHSSTKLRYSIGYFEYPIDKQNDPGIFQFVIFNFGQTIYERLNNPEACQNQAILENMRNLSEEYTRKFWLGLGKDKIVEETLWTLYTLQDGVSCISPDRGTGTIRFIESFLDLRGCDDEISHMMLISGNTRIIFNGKYGTIEKTNSSGEKHKIITFNKTGTLYEKPDENFVKFVDYFYPGTMLYAKINIKPENLEK